MRLLLRWAYCTAPNQAWRLEPAFARAFRTPDISELYSSGPHLAAYVFEVGNPELGVEAGTGVDLFVRFGASHMQAELTGFYNDIAGYIYGQETGRVSRVLLPVYQFQAADALLTGLKPRWTGESRGG